MCLIGISANDGTLRTDNVPDDSVGLHIDRTDVNVNQMIREAAGDEPVARDGKRTQLSISAALPRGRKRRWPARARSGRREGGRAS